MSKPRILFITPLPPPVHGSAMVSNYIRESGLMYGEFDCNFVNLSTSRSMNEIGKFPLIKIWRFVCTYFSVLWLLLTHRYALTYLAITVNGIGFLKDCPYVLMARLLCRRRVIHQHNKGMAGFAQKPLNRWLLKAAYKDAKVILLSWNLYEDISSIVPRENVVVCPNGLPEASPLDKDIPSTGSGTASAPTITNILYLSNLVEGKGVYVTLDACKILKDKGLEFRAEFVGGVSKQISKENFEEAVRERGLEACVEYVGPKYGNDKEVYWQKAEVFVFPTFYYNECFPLVLLEAMQHHLPVVTSNEGGIPDIVADGMTGFVVNAQNLRENSCDEMLGKTATEQEREQSRLFNALRGAETAAALEKLITDAALRKQMGEAGYEKYKRELTIDAFEKRIVECLKAAIK